MAAHTALSLRHLRCFLAVARQGSFTSAAAELFTTQSSLTATIQQFEQRVGLKLFDRTTRRVQLTPEGATFVAEAEALLRRFDSAIGDLAALAEGDRGQIRIAAAASVIHRFLARVIDEFRARYPGVSFVLRDGGSEQVERMLLGGEIDFAIASRHLGHEALDHVPVLTDRYGVVCAPGHPLARTTRRLRWSELPAAGHIRFTRDTGIGTFLREHVGHLPLFEGLGDEISSTSALFALLRSGRSYSVVPALAADSGNRGASSLCFLELEGPVLSREICLITRRLRSLSPNARRLLESLLGAIAGSELPTGVRALT